MNIATLKFDNPVEAYDFLIQHFRVDPIKTGKEMAKITGNKKWIKDTDIQRDIIVSFYNGEIPEESREFIKEDLDNPNLVTRLLEHAWGTAMEVGRGYLIAKGKPGKETLEKMKNDLKLRYEVDMSRKDQFLYFVENYL